MNRPTNQNLVDEAKAVRLMFQNSLIPRSLLKELYMDYNPVANIESFLDWAKDQFPKLNCGLTAVYLKHHLGTGQIIKGSYNKEHHTFLEIGDNIIDITADQFGGPKIYVGPLKLPWSRQVYQTFDT